MSLKYRAHVQRGGWLDWCTAGQIAGTTGESLRMEAVEIEYKDPIEYRAHVQGIGWMPWVKNGETAGTTGESLRLEAIQIKGKDFRYHVHVQGKGWLDWASDGEMSGTEGMSLRAEAIQILLAPWSLEVDRVNAFYKPAPEPKPIIPKPPMDAPNPKPLVGKKIFICAGHGGSDPGAVGHGMTEADRALRGTLMLGKLLQDLGATVKLGRTADYYLSLYNRAVASDDFNSDIYISWHFNAFGDPSANGCETWYISSDGKRLASSIQSELVRATMASDRGTKHSSELYELRAPRAISVLMEPGFITNAGDAAKMSDQGLEVMANAIARGIVGYFN